jgi:hypothetical protein
VDYILHIEVSEDGEPIATLEEFHDYLGEQRARKAEAARVRKATKEAKLAAEAKAKADREATEAERQEHLAELSRLLDAAKRLVVAAEALSASGVASMMEHVEQRALVTEADRQVKAVAAYATTYGLIVPAELAHLVARVGPIKRRVGA